MSDHAGWCECPVLQYAAEVERLAKHGLIAEQEFERRRCRPRYRPVLGRARRRGPDRNGHCRWDMFNTLKLRVSDDVPVLKRRGERPGTYL